MSCGNSFNYSRMPSHTTPMPAAAGTMQHGTPMTQQPSLGTAIQFPMNEQATTLPMGMHQQSPWAMQHMGPQMPMGAQMPLIPQSVMGIPEGPVTGAGAGQVTGIGAAPIGGTAWPAAGAATGGAAAWPTPGAAAGVTGTWPLTGTAAGGVGAWPTTMAIPGVATGVGQAAPVAFEQLPATPVMDIEFTQGYLRTQIGRRVKVEFLIGTNMLVDREGTLIDVGVSYIIINEVETDDLLLCDIYSIKFVRFYY